jgi:hypothetical protein
MNDVVDRILNTYQLMRPLDADQVSDSSYAIYRKPGLCRSKRCPAAGGVRFGLFERAARRARSSFRRLLISEGAGACAFRAASLPPRSMPGGPDSVLQHVSAAVRTGSVGARSLRCHADGFTARPIIPLGGGLRIIAIGIAWPMILAVCIGIEESAVARLLDHCLGQHRRCGQARQNGHHSKEPRARHWVSPLWDMGVHGE